MSGEFIRLAPERPVVAFTADEAVTVAKAAFRDARVRYSETQTEFGHLAWMLFDSKMVTRARLKGMRYAARKTIERAPATEAALTRAIEALEATRARES